MMEPFRPNLVGNFQKSFEQLSWQMLHEGYLLMLGAAWNKTGWEEEKLTAHYISYMKESDIFRKHPVSIDPEPRIYNYNHTHGSKVPKSAPRIDIQFTWASKNPFLVETKVLFEQKRKQGVGVVKKTIDNHKRYIETGIEHFLSGHYPLPGCLVGYLVECDTGQIVSSINNIIVVNGFSPRVGNIEQEATPIYPELYFSTNQSSTGQEIHLRHFMLKL